MVNKDEYYFLSEHYILTNVFNVENLSTDNSPRYSDLLRVLFEGVFHAYLVVIACVSTLLLIL